MAQVLFSQALDAYGKFQTLTDTDAAKKTAIQTTAFMGAGYAAYLAARTRIIGATIVMMPSTVLWMNQDAFLHKALSENVASFSVENERLGTLIGQFESIGMNLKDLTASEREQLQAQMRQFNDLFKALTETVREQTETVREQTESTHASHAKLRESVDLSTSKLTQAQMTLALVFEQVIQTFRSVKSAKTDIPALTRQVEILNGLARSALQQERF